MKIISKPFRLLCALLWVAGVVSFGAIVAVVAITFNVITNLTEAIMLSQGESNHLNSNEV
ncbi:hypothetical protein [Dyadobacter sp.]|uniref:hypothetical protein n=1 Tax=Dyadobacter sp. TaxID=1914288 RepID=UPI003F6ECCF0